MRWKNCCGGRGFPSRSRYAHVDRDVVVNVLEQAIAPKRVARDLGNASPKRCMACIMFADCITSIADLRVLDDLRVSRGTPPTVEEQNTARFARSDSLAAVEAVARRHGTRKKN